MEEKHTTLTKENSGISRRQFLARGAAFTFAAAVTGPGLTVLSSCGGGGSASGALKFWQFYAPGGDVPAQSKWFENTVDAWNKKNETQIKLEYIPVTEYLSGSKLQTAFSSGEGPDIFIISPGDFLRYYNGGVLEDLSQYMEEDAKNDFYENVMTTRTVDGKYYALPMEVEPMAMYYSVKAFEEAGLSEADIPTTWEGLLDVAGKLKKGDSFGLLFDTNPGYYRISPGTHSCGRVAAMLWRSPAKRVPLTRRVPYKLSSSGRTQSRAEWRRAKPLAPVRTT